MWPEIRSQKKLLQPDFLPFLKDPITLSDDEQGVYNHLRNVRVIGSLGIRAATFLNVLFGLVSHNDPLSKGNLDKEHISTNNKKHLRECP